MMPSQIQRGDIVLVHVPYLDLTASVRRPALVVCEPTRMLDIIIAAISSRVRSPLPQTHYAIDPAHADWRASGLKLPSVVRCDRLFTIGHAEVHRVLGHLSDATLNQIDNSLKAALGIG